MANQAKHAYGNSENLMKAVESGAVDAYDILFLDGDTDPKIGWVDKNGEVKIVKGGSVDNESIDAMIDEKLAESIVTNEDIEDLFE